MNEIMQQKTADWQFLFLQGLFISSRNLSCLHRDGGAPRDNGFRKQIPVLAPVCARVGNRLRNSDNRACRNGHDYNGRVPRRKACLVDYKKT